MRDDLVHLAVAEGWHLFPLVAGTKRPAVVDWERAAWVPDLDEAAAYREMFDMAVPPGWPARDSGIACGPTGWVVIDLDTSLDDQPDGAESLRRAAAERGEEVTPTRTVRTRSGGWQLVYAAIPGREIRNSCSRSGVPLVGPNVDVRGVGGYVVCPGAYVEADRKPGGWYTITNPRPPVPLPDWLADLLVRPALEPARERATRSAASSARRRGGTVQGSARGRLVGLIATVIEAPTGRRNHLLHWAACRAAEMAAGGLVRAEAAMVALEEAGRTCGLDDGECRRTVASAFAGEGR